MGLPEQAATEGPCSVNAFRSDMITTVNPNFKFLKFAVYGRAADSLKVLPTHYNMKANVNTKRQVLQDYRILETFHIALYLDACRVNSQIAQCNEYMREGIPTVCTSVQCRIKSDCAAARSQNQLLSRSTLQYFWLWPFVTPPLLN